MAGARKVAKKSDAIGDPARTVRKTPEFIVGRVRAFLPEQEVVMPTADAVLSWATGVANDWRWLATVWHLALGALLTAVVASRISRRVLGFLLTLPIASVAAVAAMSGNPFNAATFAIVTALLVRSAARLPATGVEAMWRRWTVAGVLLIAFGWVYPHFLATDTWSAYVYASPFGLLPCPMLSVVIGVTLVFDGFRSSSWNGVLAAAGVVYGVIGVFRLGVVLDVWLLAGATLLGMVAVSELTFRPGMRGRGLGCDWRRGKPRN